MQYYCCPWVSFLHHGKIKEYHGLNMVCFFDYVKKTDSNSCIYQIIKTHLAEGPPQTTKRWDPIQHEKRNIPY